MGTLRKTITLTDQQDIGRADLIRREQERSLEIEAIRTALVEGEASGEPKRFDIDAFKQKMRTAHG